MAGRTIVITKDVGIFRRNGAQCARTGYENPLFLLEKPGKHHTGRSFLVLAAAFTLSFTFTYTNAQGP